MKENNLLEKTLKIADERGYAEACEFLLKEKGSLEEDSPSVYYYLICLFAGCNKTDEAMKWVKAADARGWWFRRDALDDDLLPLAGIEEYKSFLLNCEQREDNALRECKVLCTFNKKRKNKLALCLHGNGQNAEIALSDWKSLFGKEWQLEALQSARPDSFGRFRWEDNDEDWRALLKADEQLPLADFDETALAGFSAGCNMILRALTLSKLSVKRIFLQSPWIPFFEKNEQAVTAAIKEKAVSVYIACGTEDEDCKEHAERLYSALCREGAAASLIWQKGNMHGFPENGERVI